LTEPLDQADGQVRADDGEHGPDQVRSVLELVEAFTAVPAQVRQARRFLARVLAGCPAADDAILCLSELASNCVLHSASRKPGGTFVLQAQIAEGKYVRIELRDEGGPWIQRPSDGGHSHGLDIVRMLATETGVAGDPLNGWITWATLDWNGGGGRSGHGDAS
jgi:hypothetical protein